jgi:hypothetical protein
MIHAIGDSHVELNFRNDDRFKVHHIGPITMYHIGKHGLTLPEPMDKIVYSFGEIDVRCHIIKQREISKQSVENIISNLAFNYVQKLIEITPDNSKAVALSVIPPTNFGYNAIFPKVGTLAERIMVRIMLNIALEKYCKDTVLTFVDPYEGFADSNGVLRYDMSDGDVHVGDSFKHIVADKVAGVFA